MELLQSNKFKLPYLNFISDKSEIKDIPIGTPFIYGDAKDKEYIIQLLEYEILYQKALQSGMPFNFKQILLDEGFGLEEFDWIQTTFIDYITDESEGDDWDIDNSNTIEKIDTESNLLKRYIHDAVAVVDINKLKELNIFPTWLNKVEEAVNVNLHNFGAYDYNLYNKKLGGMYGNITFTNPGKNLIIADISYSIPKGVGATILAFIKNLAQNFYADVMITGRRTILIPYEELHTFNVDTAYKLYGNGQECEEFRHLVTSERKVYNTAIVFGDNHHPGDTWDSQCRVSDEDGKKRCLWEVDKLISFHTTSSTELAGYSRWFSPKHVDKISNWVKYLNN